MARPKGSFKQPSYRLHRATGQAVTTVDGRDCYLGIHGSPESRQKYNRLIGEWLLRGGQGPSASAKTATVAQIAAGYIQAAGRRYSASKLASIIIALRWLTEAYGDTRGSEFEPHHLRALRLRMADADAYARGGAIKRRKDRKLTRGYVNDLVYWMIRMFRWGKDHGMCSGETFYALQSIERLVPGESAARETEEVQGAPQEDVDAVLAIATPTVQAMIRFQLLTGVRPGEMCAMRICDIDMSDPKCWVYKPTANEANRQSAHKNAWRGQERIVGIGPEAQKVIRPYIRADLSAHVFNPRESWAERVKARGYKLRRTVMRMGTHYSPKSYLALVKALCGRADRLAHERRPEVPAKTRLVNNWHPHQLRHSAGFKFRSEFDLDVTQAVLGHKTRRSTERYAKVDMGKAVRAIAKIG